MKQLLLILMVSSLFCQTVPSQVQVQKMSTTEKLMLYESEKKETFTGIFYTWLVPSGGHIYTGNWRRGLLFAIPEVGLSVAGIFMLMDDEDVLPIIFFSGSGLIRIIECIDVTYQVKKYNKSLYKQIFGEEPPSFSFKLQPKYGGAKLTMSYSFN